MITLKSGKYIHIMWQAPQIILITVAEVMIIITLLEFSFTQVNKIFEMVSAPIRSSHLRIKHSKILRIAFYSLFTENVEVLNCYFH